jgi:pyruvate,water dikinase
MMAEPVLVRRLDGVGAADVGLVGGKAASLGELASAGFPVPPGYVVTAEAFARTMDALDASGAIRAGIEGLPPGGVAAIARTASRVRACIMAAPLPDNLRSAVAAGYHSLTDGSAADLGTAGPPNADGTFPGVAVRSSATMEDSAAASFAGLQDSYLGVRGADEVLARVRGCWASMYNDESVAYRRRMNIPEHDLAMGVVVQRMVQPRSAGVMFTRSPVSGDRSVVAIEGTWGLGSALVSGDVTPDSFAVSKVTGEITSRKVGAKLSIHKIMPNGSGVAAHSMPERLREKACLSDDEIRALTRIARQVEDHYGTPQDIEWALVEDRAEAALGELAPGELAPGHAATGHAALSGVPPAAGIVLLQSRPETVWSAREAHPAAAPKPKASDHVVALFRSIP